MSHNIRLHAGRDLIAASRKDPTRRDMLKMRQAASADLQSALFNTGFYNPKQFDKT